MDQMERLDRQFAFLREIDKEKEITRQNYLASGSRREGDAEHAWHLAIMALLLGEYAPEGIDLLRVVSMVLIHDLVEIDAGDTYVYDAAGVATQRERELAAADRIFVLGDKGVLEEGSHEELLKKGGEYAKLYQIGQ